MVAVRPKSHPGPVGANGREVLVEAPPARLRGTAPGTFAPIRLELNAARFSRLPSDPEPDG